MFDVLNPGLIALGLPLPLGGTSNHFRASVLRRVGAWDAWNVTEDADLGFRLARFGYRTVGLASATDEEAPARLGAWFGQRRRWCKGWFQTAMTLCRDPLRLVEDLGVTRAFLVVLLLAAMVVGPLAWTICAGLVTYELFAFGLPNPADPLELAQATLWMSVALAGAGLTIFATLLGMRRRGLAGLWPFLPLLLLYNLMISAAAWAAVYDLLVRPHHWHKTEHGLAKTSRRSTTCPGRSGL